MHGLKELRSSDVFDSSDVLERIEEIRSELDAFPDSARGLNITDEQIDLESELATLVAFAEEASSNVSDWQYGETFIADWYFEDYARELAEDIGAIKGDEAWPLTYIDWERATDALKMDYTSFELDGRTFWARS